MNLSELSKRIAKVPGAAAEKAGSSLKKTLKDNLSPGKITSKGFSMIKSQVRSELPDVVNAFDSAADTVKDVWKDTEEKSSTEKSLSSIEVSSGKQMEYLKIIAEGMVGTESHLGTLDLILAEMKALTEITSSVWQVSEMQLDMTRRSYLAEIEGIKADNFQRQMMLSKKPDLSNISLWKPEEDKNKNKGLFGSLMDMAAIRFAITGIKSISALIGGFLLALPLVKTLLSIAAGIIVGVKSLGAGVLGKILPGGAPPIQSPSGNFNKVSPVQTSGPQTANKIQKVPSKAFAAGSALGRASIPIVAAAGIDQAIGGGAALEGIKTGISEGSILKGLDATGTAYKERTKGASDWLSNNVFSPIYNSIKNVTNNKESEQIVKEQLTPLDKEHIAAETNFIIQRSLNDLEISSKNSIREITEELQDRSNTINAPVNQQINNTNIINRNISTKNPYGHENSPLLFY